MLFFQVQIFFSLISLTLIKCEPPVQYGAPVNNYNNAQNYDANNDGHEYSEVGRKLTKEGECSFLNQLYVNLQGRILIYGFVIRVQIIQIQ